ncbi:MAG: hypothetical protein MR266_04215 [Erysipelotrichaceae bacterium]|mgnify:CR=1 FL=1|nr:hypothetical protein [Erysipelotrichaceae bacterium]
MKGINNYFERIKDPTKEIIDFNYLYTHPEAIYLVWEKYSFDLTFKMEVNRKMYLDNLFKKRFNEVFKNFLDKDKIKKR